MSLLKKCDYCGKKMVGKPLKRYFRTFCSKDHVASYFGAYVEENWNEVYWSDFL